ncbi:MAG TPA: ferrous iron transport protein A [Archaeoglobus profundus]|nr:ferrous iron transport protein A [Archaeoglobus profundus]
MSLNSHIPLAFAREGTKGTVVSIIGGRGVFSRLIAMGIMPGREVEVIMNRGGAVLVSVNGSKFALGRGIAMKVIINVK